MTEVLTALDAILAPSRSALLVVDVQNDFIHPEGWAARHHPGGPSLRHVIPPINRLIGAARAAARAGRLHPDGARTRHRSSQLPGALRGAGDGGGHPVRGRRLGRAPRCGGAFRRRPATSRSSATRTTRSRAPPLHGLLRERGVESVVGTGVVTNLCVQTTIQHAFALGYYVVVAEDATAAVDPTVQAVTLDNFRLYFGPVVPSETIDRHWAPAHDSRVRGAAPA